MRELLTAKDISWQHIQEPSNDELAEFVRDVNLLPHDAEFVVRDHQRPEAALREQYMLILIHVPVFDKQLRVTSGAALYVLVTERHVYTLAYEPIVTLQKIFQEFSENPAKQEEYFGDSPLSLALHVISQLHGAAFRKIRRMEKHIEIAEDAVFQGNERRMVEEVAILARDVLDFRRIIRPQIALFERVPDPALPADVVNQWQRIHGQVSQMWEMLDSLHDSAKELRNTNDSLLQHKENELLRLLSFYSIVAIPLWILVTPFTPTSATTAADYIVFWSILGLLVVLLLFIFLRFRHRRVL